jgi:hypothetical protein
MFHGYLTAARRAREQIRGRKIESVTLLISYRSKKNFCR